MNLILLAGCLINPLYIKRIKALNGPITVISRDEMAATADRKYVVYLDGPEEIMINQSELDTLWRHYGVEQ